MCEFSEEKAGQVSPVQAERKNNANTLQTMKELKKEGKEKG